MPNYGDYYELGFWCEWYAIQSIFTPKRRYLARLSPLSYSFFACDGPIVERCGVNASWTIFAGLYLGASALVWRSHTLKHASGGSRVWLRQTTSAHADDVRTLTSSLPCLKQRVYLVQDFASRNCQV